MKYIIYENTKDFRRLVAEDIQELDTDKRLPQYKRNWQAQEILIAQGYPNTVVCREIKGE